MGSHVGFIVRIALSVASWHRIVRVVLLHGIALCGLHHVDCIVELHRGITSCKSHCEDCIVGLHRADYIVWIALWSRIEQIVLCELHCIVKSHCEVVS